MVFRINEGTVNDVDLSGVAAVVAGDSSHATYVETHEKGSEGAIYTSDHTTPEQSDLLDTFAVNALGEALVKEVT
jgi:hypothetical protein